ncbi:septum formation family protein [Frankia sp. AgB1.9]|nr:MULTISPECIES: septum formation family protein [unclassified Frankia]MBL7486632.1 septum formation family protein [Frankia sp. AgW1.1]MBL7553965.1 septum formation family protein [Frankia sp. AgB1.9]MBL7617824.1 septum formation family protein [Frankia sp. AgB1.8]
MADEVSREQQPAPARPPAAEPTAPDLAGLADGPPPDARDLRRRYLEATGQSTPARPTAGPGSPASPGYPTPTGVPTPAGPPLLWGSPQLPSQPSPVGRSRRRKARAALAVTAGVVVLAALGLTAVGITRGRGGGSADAAAVAAPTRTPGALLPTQPAGSASPAATLTGTPDPELDGRDYLRGDCYRWNQDADHTVVQDVSCQVPHLFEAVADAPVSIAADYPPGARYPSDADWDAIGARYCTSPVETYLGYPLDPHGRFVIGRIVPTESGWRTDDRDVVCGLQGVVPSVDESPGRIDLITGAVRGVDQSFVYPTGECLDSVTAADVTVVDCAATHDLLAIGDTRLPDTTTGAPPSDAVIERQCLGVAHANLGPAFQETATVRVGWFQIAPESWRVGSHTTTCTVSYVTAAGDPRGVMGEQLHPAGRLS